MSGIGFKCLITILIYINFYISGDYSILYGMDWILYLSTRGRREASQSVLAPSSGSVVVCFSWLAFSVCLASVAFHVRRYARSINFNTLGRVLHCLCLFAFRDGGGHPACAVASFHLFFGSSPRVGPANPKNANLPRLNIVPSIPAAKRDRWSRIRQFAWSSPQVGHLGRDLKRLTRNCRKAS